MDIGKRIRDLREERGLTQREVARRAGLTPSGVGFIEHGQTRKPSAETVVAIARALGVPVKELLEEPVAPLGEASETGPDRARSEALRQWEQGHKAIARAIADAFGFSVADLMEEPPASLAEAPRETGPPDEERSVRDIAHAEALRQDARDRQAARRTQASEGIDHATRISDVYDPAVYDVLRRQNPDELAGALLDAERDYVHAAGEVELLEEKLARLGHVEEGNVRLREENARLRQDIAELRSEAEQEGARR
jgi:transcriptional regulator with XRE-family HTH domain